jgi:hypothetical protein
MAEFLENWIFQDSSSADLSSSWLNRHVLLHGMAPANINKQIDANRLILFFDLMISYLSIPAKKFYVFIPDKEPSIETRKKYFFELLLGHETPFPLKTMLETEEGFLSENRQYRPPEATYGLKDSLNRNNRLMKDIDAFITDFSKKVSAP